MCNHNRAIINFFNLISDQKFKILVKEFEGVVFQKLIMELE